MFPESFILDIRTRLRPPGHAIELLCEQVRGRRVVSRPEDLLFLFRKVSRKILDAFRKHPDASVADFSYSPLGPKGTAPMAKEPRWDGPRAKAEGVPVVIHEKNATTPPMLSWSQWASIPGRKVLRQYASTPKRHPWTMTATMALP